MQLQLLPSFVAWLPWLEKCYRITCMESYRNSKPFSPFPYRKQSWIVNCNKFAFTVFSIKPKLFQVFQGYCTCPDCFLKHIRSFAEKIRIAFCQRPVVSVMQTYPVPVRFKSFSQFIKSLVAGIEVIPFS